MHFELTVCAAVGKLVVATNIFLVNLESASVRQIEWSKPMSLRAVKQILLKPSPPLEGAGVKLQRAFGFGKTREFDPVLLLDDFQQRESGRLPCRVPLASASRHRDDHLCAGGRSGPWRQPRQQGPHDRGRRAVDDWQAAAFCTRRCPKGMRTGACTDSSCGRICLRGAEDDGPALPGHFASSAIPEVTEDDGNESPDHLRLVLGQDGSGGRRGCRPQLRRHLGATKQAAADPD